MLRSGLGAAGRSLVLSLVFASLMAAGGCTPATPLGNRCASAAECPEPYTCRLGRCRAECVVQRDCPSFSECVLGPDGTGTCRLPDDEACTTTASCGDGLVCVERACANPCTTVAECPEGSLCVPGPPPENRARCVRADRPGLDASFDVGAAHDAGPDAAELDVPSDVPVDAPSDVPVDVPSDGGRCAEPPCIAEVVVTDHATCARGAEDGAVWCWGAAAFLGGTAPDDCGGSGCATSPVRVGYDDPLPPAMPLPMTGAIDLSANRDVACVVLGDGRIACWGRSSAALGHGIDGSIARAVEQGAGFVEDATSVTVGAPAVLARTFGTDTYLAWGSFEYGVLGADASGLELTAVPVHPFDVGGHLTLGGWHGCALDGESDVWCWGANDFGQVTMPMSPADGGVPVEAASRVMGAPTAILDISPGRNQTCALVAGGRVWCWGTSLAGPATRPGCVGTACPPVEIQRPEEYVALGVGPYADASCAIGASGTVWCWGHEDAIPPDTTGNNDPRAVAGVPPAVSVAHAYDHGCAVDRAGQVWCWGRNEVGQLGIGSFDGTNHRTASRVTFPAP